jgi:hypothetical protein
VASTTTVGHFLLWFVFVVLSFQGQGLPNLSVSVGEARSPLDTMDAAEGFAMEIEIVPARMEHLRACLSCSLVKTFDQFFETGCESEFCSLTAGCPPALPLSSVPARTVTAMCGSELRAPLCTALRGGRWR